MKRILDKKMPKFFICWSLIVGMLLLSSPAFGKTQRPSPERDSRPPQKTNNYPSYGGDKPAAVRVVPVQHRQGNVIPAIIATGLIAGITLSLLDRNDPPPSPPQARRTCPAAFGQVLYSASVVVTAQLLNIRSGPGLNQPPVGQLPRGTMLSIMENRGGWYYVMTPEGVSGWVMTQYTTPVAARVNG